MGLGGGRLVEHKVQHIWQEQCEATRSLRDRYGVVAALDYLIGEKLQAFAETAVTKPEFARELPQFVIQARDIFSGEEIRHYLEHLARMAAIDEEQASDVTDDDFLRDDPEQLAAKRARFEQLKELLTATVLGTA